MDRGHVLCMNPEHIPKIMIYGVLDDRCRPLGKQRIRYKDVVDADLKKRMVLSQRYRPMGKYSWRSEGVDKTGDRMCKIVRKKKETCYYVSNDHIRYQLRDFRTIHRIGLVSHIWVINMNDCQLRGPHTRYMYIWGLTFKFIEILLTVRKIISWFPWLLLN